MKNKFDLIIGLNELGGNQWTGGITYRNNLIKALLLLNPSQEIFVISNSDEHSLPEPNLNLVRISDPGLIQSKYDRICKKFFYRDTALQRRLKEVKPDVIFPYWISVGNATKSIYWIPDFQFVYLPQLYSKQQINQYNLRLPLYFKKASKIIVSSEDAYNDFLNFSPEYIEKVRVLKFVAHIPEGLYLKDPFEVAKIYNLPFDFIYLPNQFWAHKNHFLVLDALALLKQSGIRPFIVCSGNPSDVRNPSYLAKFLQRLSELDLRDQFAHIGLVPHEHVYSLIRQSKCVLNPSLFEGWSTTVEESKSVGKRMILSDLGVHIEQNPADSVYFMRNSAEDLAEKMAMIWNETPSGPDLNLENQAKSNLNRRMKKFASTFLDIASETFHT